MGVENNDATSALSPTTAGSMSARDKEVFLPEERSPKKPTCCQKIAYAMRIRNVYIRELLSEFLGTFILVAFGLACVAQFVFNTRFNKPHSSVTLNLGWGFGVGLGVYVAGGCSGGHINPAVTVAFATLGRLPWRKVPFYLVGQYLGAFLGAFFIYLLYQNMFDQFDCGVRQCHGNVNATSGIFVTYPMHEFIETWQCFVDQVFSTGLLMLMVMAMIDERNMQVPKCLMPIVVGLIILVLSTGFEANCGAAMNPARDLAPRFFTYIAGWGRCVFSYRNYNWFWVPVAGPHVGAILGAWLYNICVGLHWPPLNESYRSR